MKRRPTSCNLNRDNVLKLKGMGINISKLVDLYLEQLLEDKSTLNKLKDIVKQRRSE